MDIEEKKESMIWFKKHADTVMVLGGILSAMIWMNHKFATLEKDMAVIKAVLIMKNIMPPELATKQDK
jgi:hypothetical protein